MKCPKCSYNISGVGLYCPRCGTPLTSGAAEILSKRTEVSEIEIKKDELITGALIENIRNFARKLLLQRKRDKLLSQIQSLEARSKLEGASAIKEEFDRVKEEVVNTSKELQAYANVQNPPWFDMLNQAVTTIEFLRKLEKKMQDSKVITDGYLKVRDEYRARINTAAAELEKYFEEIEDIVEIIRSEVNDLLSEVDKLRVKRDIGEISDDEFEEEKSKIKEKIEEDEIIISFLGEEREKINNVIKTMRSFLPR